VKNSVYTAMHGKNMVKTEQQGRDKWNSHNRKIGKTVDKKEEKIGEIRTVMPCLQQQFS